MRIIAAGGINENDGAAFEECQDGYNFELTFGDTDWRPRKPFDLKGTATNSGDIRGIMQLIKRDDTETTLIFEDDGVTPTIYEWNGAATFTSKRTATLAIGSKLRDVYFGLDDVIVIVDVAKLTPLMKWDGTTLTRNLTGLFDGNPAAVTSITRVGTTATVTTTASHGMATGDLMVIAGAVETDYNIEAEITVTGASTYTYQVAGSPATPATGTITFDKGTELYARYGVIHNGRLWLLNVKAGATDTPHLMVASEFENIESYDTTKRAKDSSFSTGNEAFYMVSPDLRPINGATVFNKELIISTVGGRIFRLSGTDSTNYEWLPYYAGSASVGTEAMINFGNDVAFMREGGAIDTLRATDLSGDVSVDDISRWIPSNTQGLTDAIAVYDAQNEDNQRVFFFVQGKVLVLFKNFLYGSQFSPWSIYRTDHSSNFNTNAVKYLRRPGETTYSIYFGNGDGGIFDLNGVGGSGDAGSSPVRTIRKTRLVEELDTLGSQIHGNVRFRRRGQCNLTLEFDWSDEYNITDVNVPLSGPPPGDTAVYFGGPVYFGGDFYFSQGFQFADQVSTRHFSPTGRSKSFFMTQSIETNVRFQIDHIELLA